MSKKSKEEVHEGNMYQGLNRVIGLGYLTYIENLIYGNEEVLFICEDEFGQEYIVETYDSYEDVYVIGRTSEEVLDALKNNEVTIEEAFRKSSLIYKTERTHGDVFAHCYNSSTFPANMLPKKGVYLNLPTWRRGK